MTFQPPAVRDLSGAWYAVMGIDRDDPIRYKSASEWAKAPADEAWVYSCVRRIYQAGASTPLRVYVRRGKERIDARDEPSPEGDDLQHLLDYVNPIDMTGNDLKAFSLASEVVWGEWYWKKVRGKFGGPPQELYFLRSPDIEPVAPDGRSIISWNYRPEKGAAEVIEPRNMVPFRTPNLVNPLRGLSALSAIGSEISAGRAWAERVAAFAVNDSIPPGYWQIPKDADFGKQDESLVKRVLRSLRGPKNRGKNAIMPAGIEFKNIALSPEASEMIANRKVSRMAVCAATGVPLVLAGDDDKQTVYRAVREAETVFWRGTMIPKLDGYADAINNWLVPDFDASRRKLIVAFDYSEVEPLRPSLDVEWNMWLNAQGNQSVVPNEFRRHFRIGGDVPWGDKPTPRTTVTLRPDPASVPDDIVPATDPANVADLVDGEEHTAADTADALRAYGRGLYRHPAVKAWIAGSALDIRSLLGEDVPDAARARIEAGLRRRDTAAVIAASLEEAE